VVEQLTVNPFSVRWSTFFLDLAEFYSKQSKDPSTKCGAVVVDNCNLPIAFGFNGFPKSIPDNPEWLADRDTKYEMVIHAEVNAILNATASVKGCHLFVTGPSCPDCTKFIIAAGIVSVHWRLGQTEFLERWRDRLEISARIYDRAGITPFIYQ